MIQPIHIYIIHTTNYYLLKSKRICEKLMAIEVGVGFTSVDLFGLVLAAVEAIPNVDIFC